MSVPNQNQLNFTVPFTQIPNSILASWAKQYNLAELRVLMFLAIKLWGWHKTMDRISLSQFEEGTGLTRSNIIIAVKSLCKKGVIRKLKIGEKGKEEVYYQLVLPEESNNSYQYCSNTTPVLQQYPQKKEQIKKEKIYKKEKETKEDFPPMHIHGCIPLTQSVYDDAVKKHTKPFIDNIVDRMDTYYSTHPDRAKKGGCYASKLQFWIINDLKNKERKKQSEELSFRKREEEDRQFQMQQEQIQAAKEKQRLDQEKAFIEKVEANRPIVEKYIEKYPGIVRISGMIWNGVCEVVDKLHRISHLNFTDDNFERQLRQKLGEIGCLC